MIIDGPVILLQSGNYFNFLDPEGSSFTIEDIAHGLGMTSRFGGQCKRFYSVAEHSICASFHVAPEFAFAALMHDAAEAFIGDIPRPLKSLLLDYQRLERDIETAVLGRFDLTLPLPAEVKSIDLVMLATEQRQILDNYDEWAPIRGVVPLPIVLPCWTPQEAKAQFMHRFDALSVRTRKEAA